MGRLEGVFTVALTGGIGSGKSTVATFFEELGALVIDSDQLAREALERGSKGFDQVVTRFGDSILTDGEIDRAKLASVIFTDENARRDLEGIIHPIVRESAGQIARRAGQGRVVINQIPLLFETNGASRFDFVITVASDLEVRRERLRQRGMRDYEIDRRISAQATDEQRASIADVVISNNGSLDELESVVVEIWNSQLKRKEDA